MKYTAICMAVMSAFVQAAPSILESRAVGTLYPIPINGTLGGSNIFQVKGGNWNITSESGLGATYGKSAAQAVASGLAHTASLSSTSANNPYTITATASGAHGGVLNGTFVKTNYYLAWDDFNSTQWTTIFNVAVNAIVGEKYPQHETLDFLANINSGVANEGTLIVTFTS